MPTNSGPGYSKHPEHKLSIETLSARCHVTLNGAVIADTDSCLKLNEGKYPAVYYLPITAVDADLLTPSNTETYCPFKGTAQYWHIKTADPATGASILVEDALWGYPTPYDEMLPLTDHVAFYPSKVDAIDVSDVA